jgi:hypothetical protein
VSRITVVSFDIDGTLEIGEPPGVVPIALVRAAKRLGYVIGSCSDRPLSHQQDVWLTIGIDPDFTVLKHRLEDIRARFPDALGYHIGDTHVDERFALAAGFRFLSSLPPAPHPWRAELFGECETC